MIHHNVYFNILIYLVNIHNLNIVYKLSLIYNKIKDTI